MPRYVYFSLKTKTEEEKKNAEKIIKGLKKTFGKEHVKVEEFTLWKSVDIDDVGGWVGIDDVGFKDKSRFHIFYPPESGKKECYDVPLECCDTIYCM